jgi:CheY-like chemotaxis protein
MFDEVRRKPGLAHIPVIVVTAHAMVGDRERVLKRGFDHYIPKPFTMQTLLKSLLSYFESGRASKTDTNGDSTGK